MSGNKRVLAKWLRNRVLEHLEQVHTDDFFGQAVNDDGNPVPCKRFPESPPNRSYN